MLLFPAGAEGSRAPRADTRVKGAVEGGLCPGNCELFTINTRASYETHAHTYTNKHSLSHIHTIKQRRKAQKTSHKHTRAS